MTSAAQDPAVTAQTRTLCLAGPTAVGKSEVALLLAERLGAEIITVDSMQVYHGLDIGTAKPSDTERARVPHHLLDVADLTQLFSVADFLRLAREVLAQIHARGRLPLFCGGTGLYFKALLHGVGEGPPSDARLRAELRATPLPDLVAELARLDPATFASIDQKNPRRVIRALEVIRLTGKPYSALRANWTQNAADPAGGLRIFGLCRTPADLRRRIDARVEEMFRRGLVKETAELLKRGLAENENALQALGYRQVAEHLRGLRSLPETIQLVKIRTRQFAKRQMTWFRTQLCVRWVHLEAGASPANTAKRLEQELMTAR